MSETQQLLAALGKPFQKEAVKSRVGGGGSRFDYVAGFTVIHRLNDATGGQWDWRIHSFEFRPLPPDKYGKEQSLVVVTGELTIPGLGTRAGIGVQKVSENGGEDLVKGASTDALKKAATLFGVALELYGDDYEDEDRQPQPRPAPRATSTSGTSGTPLNVTPALRTTSPPVVTTTTPAPPPQRRDLDGPASPAAPASGNGTALSENITDEALLDRIFDDTGLRTPDDRTTALGAFFNAAKDPNDLSARMVTVAKAGLPDQDRKAAYREALARLARRAPAQTA